MKIYILTVLLFATMTTTAQSSYMKGTELLLHYLVREPKIKTDHPPVILLLHGVGSNENDLFSFAGQLPDNFLVISARAPYEQGPGSYAWYEVDFSTGKPVPNAAQAEKSRTVIIDFINQLKEKYHFDDARVYLCGFSQGAIMAYSVGLTRPDKIRGMAIMSGRLLDEVKPTITPNEKLRHLNVFMSHATDDKVLDIHYAREGHAFLKGLGINPEYKEYTGGHTINKEMLNDLIGWLRKR